jgi:nitrite reductase/ring-hydroxylating ferredoxin subunit
MPPGEAIADVADVPREGSLLFAIEPTDGGEPREAVLVRSDADAEDEGALTDGGEAIRAWENYCQHWTDVRLDRGDGAATRDGELVCQKHGATFRSGDGVCTFGPCEGAVLADVAVAVADGTVYLTDENYAFAGLGEADVERDRSSDRALGF